MSPAGASDPAVPLLVDVLGEMEAWVTAVDASLASLERLEREERPGKEQRALARESLNGARMAYDLAAQRLRVVISQLDPEWPRPRY